MAASSRWQEKQRQGTRVLKDGQKPVNYGLMPRGMGDCGLMDDKDMNGIFLPHNIWAVYADRLSVEAAQLLGREADLPELQKIYDTGREDLLRALDAGAMDAKYYRQCLDPFLADWERWHLAEIFGRPEDYFRACLSANAAQRTLGLNALRSNPNLIGYSMTSLFDEVGCGEGLITMFRDLKPGILDAMRDGWAPLRWSLFVAPYQLYRVARSFVDDPTTLPPVKADLAIWGKAEGLEKWLKEHGIAFHAVAAGQPLEKRETILVVGKAAKNAAPNGKGNPSTEQTYFTVLSPTNPSGAVVVFCSGGGYGCLANLGDPPPMFELLKPYGVTLVVLEYRMPRGNREIPLLDAQSMLRHVGDLLDIRQGHRVAEVCFQVSDRFCDLLARVRDERRLRAACLHMVMSNVLRKAPCMAESPSALPSDSFLIASIIRRHSPSSCDLSVRGRTNRVMASVRSWKSAL